MDYDVVVSWIESLHNLRVESGSIVIVGRNLSEIVIKFGPPGGSASGVIIKGAVVWESFLDCLLCLSGKYSFTNGEIFSPT